MTALHNAGTYRLGDRHVTRIGYGAMQLAGPGVFGPPKDREAALAVLRAAVDAGVNHIDTSDYYGPFVVNDLIREALHPYPNDLVLVTKIGARRDETGRWLKDDEPDSLRRQVEDNLTRLGIDRMEVVNFRAMFGHGAPGEGSIARQVEALARMREEGLIGHVGISNVTPTQVAEARAIAPIACVQNLYNLATRTDDAMIDGLAADGVAYTPYFPLGEFSPLQSDALSGVARQANATPMQVALAWLLARAPNILLIPGTSSVAHLHENLAAADVVLTPGMMAELDRIGGSPG